MKWISGYVTVCVLMASIAPAAHAHTCEDDRQERDIHQIAVGVVELKAQFGEYIMV